MFLRALAAAAVALLLGSAPALAQSDQEIIGRYRMTVEPEPGSVCQATQADFDVTRVGGQLIEVVLDRQSTIADWDPARKSFAGRINFPDPQHPVLINGSFSRGPDRVNLVVTVVFPPNKPCRALLSGSIPLGAASTGSMDGAQPNPRIPPSPTAPPVFGVAPNGEPPVYGGSPSASPSTPARFNGIRNGKTLGIASTLALLIGIVIGALRGKAKKAVGAPPPAAPAPQPAAPTAPRPEPAPEPEPKPDPQPTPTAPEPEPKAKKRATPRAAKPKPTEEEDELGDG